MGHADLLLGTAQQDIFLTPIELKRVTCREKQGNERVTGVGSRRLLELAHKMLNRRIGPRVAFRDDLFEKLLRCATVAPSKLQIVFEKVPKTRLEFRAQFVTNALMRPPVLRRRVVLQILLDRGS